VSRWAKTFYPAWLRLAPFHTADLKAQQGDMEIAIHPNLPDLYRRKVASLERVFG
jgi:hypothetical protein